MWLCLKQVHLGAELGSVWLSSGRSLVHMALLFCSARLENRVGRPSAPSWTVEHLAARLPPSLGFRWWRSAPITESERGWRSGNTDGCSQTAEGEGGVQLFVWLTAPRSFVCLPVYTIGQISVVRTDSCLCVFEGIFLAGRFRRLWCGPELLLLCVREAFCADCFTVYSPKVCYCSNVSEWLITDAGADDVWWY